MANKKLTLLYILVIIFLFSASLGCFGQPPKVENTSDQQPTATPTSTSTETQTPVPTATPTPIETQTPVPTATSTSTPMVAMSSPQDGSKVSLYEPIIGQSTSVSGSGLHLYVLINPLNTSNVWWAQPEAEVSDDGTWHVNAQFGRSEQQDIGAKFWVKAIVTSDTLPLGQVDNPSKVNASTKSILLTRS